MQKIQKLLVSTAKSLQMEKQVQSKSSEGEDRDFRLSLIENSDHDGTMIWKIPQFSQRMEDARSWQVHLNLQPTLLLQSLWLQDVPSSLHTG